MIKEAFGTGNTLDEAKEAALKALEAPADADIKYDVIERPKAKVLGIFGGSPAKMRAYYEYEDDPFAKAKAYLMNILKNLGVEEAEISVEADEEDVRISISCGDDYGSVIGRRGETLDAIQYLVNLCVLNFHQPILISSIHHKEVLLKWLVLYYRDTSVNIQQTFYYI